MKYATLFAIVLSLAMAEVYFQEKFEEGRNFPSFLRYRL